MKDIQQTVSGGEKGEYVERKYRAMIAPEGLISFEVVDGESDLLICAQSDLTELAGISLAAARREILSYIDRDQVFLKSLVPVKVAENAPTIVREMAEASNAFNVGPMAAVAGVIAQRVGADLIKHSPRLLVENGGDIYIAGSGDKRVSIYAGDKFPFIDIIVKGKPDGIGICTSSATIGPSLSFGSADAVTVISRTAAMADAAATALANAVNSADDMDSVLQIAEESAEISGVVIAIEDRIGIWGDLKLA
ncbi:MAG: UPF0280 family protein [Actinobacteria bacterium]|nr:UPF0280 family protein [Actinomycetota bacterium]